MARPADAGNDGAMMVELKGIEPPFPLYGDFKLAGGARFDHALLEDSGAVVAPAPARTPEPARRRRGKDRRDHLSDSRRHRAASRGAAAASASARASSSSAGRSRRPGSTGFGSRARRRILLKAGEGEFDALVAQLRAELKGQLVTVSSYRDSQENLSEQFTRTENYLSLTGLIVLVLGGIGVSSVTRVFIEQKKQAIAVLKCVGGTGRQDHAAYLAQVVALGLAGSLLGVALAQGRAPAGRRYFAESLPPNMSYGLSPGAIVAGPRARPARLDPLLRAAAPAHPPHQAEHAAARARTRRARGAV